LALPTSRAAAPVGKIYKVGILNAAVPNAASSREFCDRSDFEFFNA